MLNSNCYKEFDVSELCLGDMRIDGLAFVEKFMRQNHLDCKTLRFCRLDLTRA